MNGTDGANAAQAPGLKLVGFADRQQLAELSFINGMSVWCDGPTMYRPEPGVDVDAPPHLVAIYVAGVAEPGAAGKELAIREHTHQLAKRLQAFRNAHWTHWSADENQLVVDAIHRLRHYANGVTLSPRETFPSKATDDS